MIGAFTKVLFQGSISSTVLISLLAFKQRWAGDGQTNATNSILEFGNLHSITRLSCIDSNT